MSRLTSRWFVYSKVSAVFQWGLIWSTASPAMRCLISWSLRFRMQRMKKPWVRLPEIIIHIQTTQSLRNLLTRWWLKFQKNPWHLIRPEPLGHCVKRLRKSLVETLRGQVEAISTNCATRIISCNGSWCRCSHIGNVAQEIINNSCTLKRWKKHEGI